jgi:hypothetical protein
MPVCAAPRGGMQAEQATIRHCQHLGDFAAARFLMKHFFEELKERKVFRVGLAYAVVAWLLIQVVATVEGALNLPAWSDTLVIILLAIGFPIAVILAWAYDVTPQGIRRAAADGAGDARQPDPDSDPPAETSIAVLPFVNMSSDPEQEYFSDGISEELLNQLVTLKGVHVVVFVQGQKRGSAHHWREAQSRPHPRRQRQKGRQSRSHHSAADQSLRRLSPVVENVRPRSQRYLRHSGRNGKGRCRCAERHSGCQRFTLLRRHDERRGLRLLSRRPGQMQGILASIV